MAENQVTKSRRDNVRERLSTRYPDRDFTEEEAMFGQIDDDYADYEKRLGEYQERENVLNEGLAKDPRAANFFVRIMKGENPWSTLVEMVGIDGITELINDPAKQEELAEANKAYVDRLAREKSIDDEYNTNFAESLNTIEQMKNEQGLTDETIDAAMEWLTGILDDAVRGKYSRETIDMALKALHRDADIENARMEGEIAGRNEKIDEQLRKPKQGDGMPAMGGSSATPREKSRGSLIDYANSIGVRV